MVLAFDRYRRGKDIGRRHQRFKELGTSKRKQSLISEMVLLDSQSVCADAYRIARREGIPSLLIAGTQHFDISPLGYAYYILYKYKRTIDTNCVDEESVFRTVRVDPNSIEHSLMGQFDKWKNMGEVQDGDWDHVEQRFRNRNIVDAMYKRFEKEKDWTQIKYVQNAIESIEAGESTWNGCRSIEDVWDRCAFLDDLFQQIRTCGFKSQAEIRGKNPKKILLSGAFDRSQTDIAVHIARDGELIFADGNHRLAFAKILDLDEVPVRIVVRHAEWQDIREEVRKSNDIDDLSEKAKRYLDHPDIKYLL